MRNIRVIPVLLLTEGKLVKSLKFKNYKYVGDPINTVKIFNDKEVDEICILDITATSKKTGVNLNHIIEIVSEAFMPLAYGGGVNSIREAEKLFFNGVEKIVLNNATVVQPELITAIANRYGSQSIVASIDYKYSWLKKASVFTLNGTQSLHKSPVDMAKEMEDRGAGEILLNCIERDGTYTGYDLEMIDSIHNVIGIPIIACGGAGNTDDFRKAVDAGASAVSAGSMFVFQRPHNAVLISYPPYKELVEKLNS